MANFILYFKLEQALTSDFALSLVENKVEIDNFTFLIKQIFI